MKIALLTGLALGLCVSAPVWAADEGAPKSSPASGDAAGVLKNDTDKFSYSIGLNWGTQCRLQSLEMNTEVLLRGFFDGLSNKAPLMSQQDIQMVQEQVRKQIMARNEARQKEAREKNQAAADKFFAENGKKEGVKTTASGLQYKVIKEGSGPKPKLSDRVAVHYRGTLLNGTEFDASSKRGPEPAVFGVAGVIKGWTEALTNMPVGSKWELYIPPQLAYGDRQSGPIIEPNSALIFEVELVDIKAPEPPPQPITSDIIKVPSKAELDKGAKIEVIKPEDLHKYTNAANASTNKAAAPPTKK